jgi:hypothetical protein
MEREVEESPDLLPNGSKMLHLNIVKVELIHKILANLC